MIDHLEIIDGVLAVHMSEISGKTIRAFATGRFAFDSGMRSAVFGSLAAVDLPRDLRLEEGAEIRMRLIDPDSIALVCAAYWRRPRYRLLAPLLEIRNPTSARTTNSARKMTTLPTRLCVPK